MTFLHTAISRFLDKSNLTPWSSTLHGLEVCQSKSIQREAKEVKYNIPELFID